MRDLNSQVVSYTSAAKCLKTSILLLFPMVIIISPVFLISFDMIPTPPIVKYAFFVLAAIIIFPLIIFEMLPFWAFCLYRAFVRLPAVTLSDEGIIETSQVFNAGLVKWSELSDIAITYYGPKKWLLIITHDPKPIWARMSFFKKLHSKFQKIFVESPFMIPEHLIEGTLNELADKIQSYRETNIKESSTQDSAPVQGENIAGTAHNLVLFFSIVVFVIVNLLHWVGGLLNNWVFILIIVMNALLTAWFSLRSRTTK